MSTQMNTRIDDSLKLAGDAAFAEAGYTPSQVVRALWGFASRNKDNAQAVMELLGTLEEQNGAEAKERARERARRMKALEASESIVDRLMDQQGFSWSTDYNPMPYEELRDNALLGRFDEKGLL